MTLKELEIGKSAVIETVGWRQGCPASAFPGYGYDPGSGGDGDKAGSDG